MTDLEQGKIKYAFTYNHSVSVVDTWFLDHKYDNKTTYEYFLTINTDKDFNKDADADLMVQHMVQYIVQFAPIVYKLCIDFNKKGCYHGHIWVCLDEKVLYETFRNMWKRNHNYTPYVTRVTDREGLFRYMDGHKISRGSQSKLALSIPIEWKQYYYSRVIYK